MKIDRKRNRFLTFWDGKPQIKDMREFLKRFIMIKALPNVKITTIQAIF
jgi:hypothetical protein